MAQKTSGKQMSINIIASLVSFTVTIGINFFLTPYLVKTLGTAAYGFIGLANNFVSYATIITSALNSMSGRFISIAYHRGDIDKASRLFSSVLVADLVLAGAMLIVTSFLTLYIDNILQIPAELVTSVKITFGLTFLTFVISVITAIFTTATFVKNRLELNSIRDIISHLLKIVLVILLFTFLPAQLYFLALATLGSGLFLLVANVSVKKKILPDVKVSFKKFEFGLIKTILFAGVWISLSQLSNVLMSGLDLLIANIAIGATLSGLLSIAKTVPQCMGVLISTLSGVFTPHYTILYSKNKIPEMIKEVKFTSRILSYILTVPLAGFIVFGYEFYALWQPTKTPDEVQMIQLLSILTCLMYLFTAHTQCLMMLYTVYNKLKVPVFVNLGIGIASTLIVVLTLTFGNLGANGVYVIAGVSSFLMCLKSLVFMPLYTSYISKQKKSCFYSTVIRGCIAFAIIAVIFMLLKPLFMYTSWVKLIIACVVCGVVGYIASVPLLFSKTEIKQISNKILKKFKKAG